MKKSRQSAVEHPEKALFGSVAGVQEQVVEPAVERAVPDWAASLPLREAHCWIPRYRDLANSSKAPFLPRSAQ